LGLAAVILPLWTWNVSALDASRADGALFSFLVVLLAVFALFAKPRQLPPTALPGFWFWFGALLCALFPLALAAQDVAGWAPLVGGLADRAPLLSAWLLAALVAASLPREGSAEWLKPLVYAVAAAGAFALIQAFGLNLPGVVPFGRLRPAYPFQGLSQATEVLVPCLLLAVALLPSLRQRPVLWLLVCAPMALEAGFLSSNAGRLALLAGVALGLWRQRDRRVAWIAIVALFVCGELLRPLLNAGGGDGPVTEVPRGMEVRWEIDKASAAKFATTPSGLGLGQFENDYPSWRPEAEAMAGREALREAGRLRQPKTPHNEILLAILESGWLGAALLLAMLLRLLRARQLHSPGPRLTDGPWLALGILALVRSPFSDNPAALGMAALLLAEDFRGYAKGNLPQAGPAFAAKLRTAAPVATLALGVAAVLPAWPQWRGEQLSAQAFAGEEFDAQAMNDAVEARSWDSRCWVLLSSYYLAANHYDEARLCLRQALMVAPYDLSALTAAIKIEFEAPDGDETLLRGLIGRGESFAPYEPSIQDARVRWLTHYRDEYRSRAVQLVKQGIPGAADLWAAMNLAEACLAQVEGDDAKVKRSLMQAASYLPGKKAVIERAARLESFDQRLLEELCLRVYPNWPQLQNN
jgi:hypothetical protein